MRAFGRTRDASNTETAQGHSLSRSSRRSGERTSWEEKLIAGVPARVMRPRIVFLVCLAALLLFGLLMVYSASSVEALKETGSSVSYFQKQATFILAGLVLMAIVAAMPLSVLRSDIIWVVWLVFVLLLFLVLVAGRRVGGARRWIIIAGQQFQPSEFAKWVVVVTAAKVFYEYYEERSINTARFLGLLGGCVVVPLLAIIAEPDMGTCLIIAGTVFAMCFFAGFNRKFLLMVLLVGGLVALIFIFSSPYRVERLLLGDPWEDQYGDGYQATLAIMAFASGGLFGRGIGNSTMKYHYLPEAHNDYILAIIGEEVGFVGTLIFFAVFALMIYAAFKIAWQSPSIQGRLIASGSALLIAFQFLVNMLGILAITPMTGKTLPFISYGGSSMIASLALMGLVLRVSLESNPTTIYDVRRDDFAVLDESTAGEATPRSSRSRGFTVLDGGGDTRPPRGGTSRMGRDRMGRDRTRAETSRRSSTARSRGGFGGGGGYGRVDMHDDAADRLRSRDTVVRARYGSNGSTGRTRAQSTRGRGRYDR